MSTTTITCEKIDLVRNHLNADRLDIVKVLGYHIVTGRDEFKEGDKVIYFPPDILIPEQVSTALGVTKYLKESFYPGDNEKTRCRVSACRIRGVASYGFVILATEGLEVGTDVTNMYQGHKYIPPVTNHGDAARDLPNFHIYTDIENIQRYPKMIEEGTLVRITEKIHGSSNRLGYVKDENGHMMFVAGSHRRRLKSEYESGVPSMYWEPMTVEMQTLLTTISSHYYSADVIIFGEIFGPRVQDLEYGQNKKTFRVFDISVNGSYLDWNDIKYWASFNKFTLVPLLYTGEFNSNLIEELTSGPTTFHKLDAPVKSKFKGREGIVITPLKEQVDQCGNRVILKSVSVDYHNRHNATDNE